MASSLSVVKHPGLRNSNMVMWYTYRILNHVNMCSIGFWWFVDEWCTIPQMCPPLPWASVHWLVQFTLECHWNATGWSSVHWDTTGRPSEYLQGTLEHHWKNLVETAPDWDATGETVTFAAYTGTPLEGLLQPTHAPTHIVKACRVASIPVWNDKMAGHQ